MKIFEEKILDYLKKNPNSDLKRITKGLENLELDSEYLKNYLKKLEIKGIIYQNKDGAYILLEDKPSIICGKVHYTSNGDICVCDANNNKVTIPSNYAEGILERDIVTAHRTFTDGRGITFGKLDKILKRNLSQISCEVIFENGKNKLIQFNSKRKVYIDVDQKTLDKYGAGEILLIKLELCSNEHCGKIIKRVGHKDEPDIDEKSIAYNHGFEVEFSEKYLKELEKIPTTVNSEAEIKKGRKDLRHLNIFTIDGSDTKDIDDSIAIELLPNGNYKLYVNIADVAHYIPEGSVLDKEAYDRGTSVYMNDTVNPMFHPKISNGICSLHPNVDRLTKTCEMIIDKNGKVVDYDIYDSIICSRKKMTYENVNKILINNESVEGYEPFVEDLKLMHELSQKLENGKKARGYINFSKSEMKAKGKGINIEFSKRTQQEAEKLIENFMLIANETVAKHVFFRGLPFLYRIHEEPDEEKVKAFLLTLEELGIEFKHCKSITTNKFIQEVANKISELGENSEFLSEMLLMNTMKKAKYSNLNIKHFGLALKHYTHFTSPIRRYADLTVHRLLNFYNKYYNFDYSSMDDKLRTICNHCTERSNAAEKAEREAHEMRIAEYLENNIGALFDAYIIDITSCHIKIKTSEGFYGNINIHDLKDDIYEYDKKTSIMKGKKSGKIYSIGMNIKVVVTEASKTTNVVKFTTQNSYKKEDKGTVYKKKKGSKR